MTGANDHDRAAEDEPVATPPWHHSTPAVLGASVVALAVIGLVVAAAVFITGQFNRPDSVPVEPAASTTPATTDSALPAPTTTATTTGTITSTNPPVTSDIDVPSDTPSSTSGTTSSSGTTSGEPTSRRESEAPDEPDEDDQPSTTRRPRFNETRTLYPAPVN